MYASGYVANSYLTFKALAKVAKTSKEDKLGISVTLDVNLNPFEYDIGAYYRFIKCDFRKIFKFKWRKICSWGTMHKKPLVQGKFG